jgi:hypothetical protein
MSEDFNTTDAMVTLLLQNDEELQCSADSLSRHSHYFRALLSSGMVESQTKIIELRQLDPRAVRCFVHYCLEHPHIELWPGFSWGTSSADSACLEEALDYLQIDNDLILSTIHSTIARCEQYP